MVASEILPRVKWPVDHEWRSHEWCSGPFTSGEISIHSSGAHMSSSFSYIICIFTEKVSTFYQQCVNGNLHTAALCRNMHILCENGYFLFRPIFSFIGLFPLISPFYPSVPNQDNQQPSSGYAVNNPAPNQSQDGDSIDSISESEPYTTASGHSKTHEAIIPQKSAVVMEDVENGNDSIDTHSLDNTRHSSSGSSDASQQPIRYT